MYCLATNALQKNESKKNASVSFVLITVSVLTFLFTSRDAAVTMNSVKVEITQWSFFTSSRSYCCIQYLALQLCPYSPTRALRLYASKLLQVPCSHIRFGTYSFHVFAPTLWNSLPHSIRFCELSGNTLKYFIFNRYFLAPLIATHRPSASDSVFNFWRFIN